MAKSRRPAADRADAVPRLRIDSTDIAIGARIRVRRMQLGFSQQTLAEGLGVSYQQVQKYERGMDRISVNMLMRIARRLNSSVGWLIGEEPSAIGEGVARSLTAPGALELLDIYAKIENPATRRRILALMEDLAGAPTPANLPHKPAEPVPKVWRRGIKREEGATLRPQPVDVLPRRPRGRPPKNR
jgi:transcriptional regulator with XRE-family HTH domain